MTDNITTRVGFYARVSSDQQAKDDTIDSQVEALRGQIKTDGLAIEEELCFIDEGYSGGTLLRPALERMRDVVAAGAMERLYIHSPDRLARKYAYQVLLVDELQRCGVELVFLNRRIGTSPEEDLLLQVQGMVAEYERAKIMERSRRGKRHAARRGDVNVLSSAPYGYRYTSKHEGNGQACYRVILEEARVVTRVFGWVGRDRFSLGAVCRKLADEGIQSPRGKNYWNRSTVCNMLRNPAYKGSAAFGKTRTGPLRPRLRAYRGQSEQPRRAYSTYAVPAEEWIHMPVPAIVSEELFDEVGLQLVENHAKSRQRKRGASHLLQGLLVCRCCCHAYYGKPVSAKALNGKRRDYVYYRCLGTDAYRFGGQRVCDNKQVRADTLEAAVWEDVCLLLNDPHRVEQEYQRRLTRKEDGSGSDGETYDRQISQLKRAIARLIDAYEDGLVDRSEFEPRIKRTRSRLAVLESESKVRAEQESQQDQLRLAIGLLQEFAEKIKDGINEADWMTRREIIRALVKRIEVGKESVRVVYRISPSPLAASPEHGILQHCTRRGFPPARE